MGHSSSHWPVFKLFLKGVFNKPKLLNMNRIKSKGDERHGIPDEIGQMIFQTPKCPDSFMWSSPVPKKTLPTGNRSLKAFEAKGSPPASPSLTKFPASLRMRNRYHGTNLSRDHRETSVIACMRNISQQLPNHSYLHPLHFGCLSFIIWPYIEVKYIISSGVLSVTAQSHDYTVQGTSSPWASLSLVASW